MYFKNNSYKNRGKNLEAYVNTANDYYMSCGSCAVFKVPTPKKILWKNCNGYRVPVKAIYEDKAWVDYTGVVNSIPITFDAKETQNKTSFPLSNIKQHQMEKLDTWVKCGGKAFLIVYFVEHEKMYLLSYEILKEYWDSSLKGGRKSIPYKEFEDNCIAIVQNRMIMCDWLTSAKQYIGG